MEQKLISVIVPVKNGGRTIEKCLLSLTRQDYPSNEIIIVDDGSTDNTAEILGRFTGIISLTLPESRGPGYCRNLAIKTAKGELIAFTDADCVAEANWLSELAKCFTLQAGQVPATTIRSEVTGAGGAQKIPEDDTDFGKTSGLFLETIGFVSDYIKNDGRITRTLHNPSCNSIYRKSFLTESGGFREDLWPGEDIELDFFRMKSRKKDILLLYNPSAVVYHYRSPDFGSFTRMMLRYGYALGRIAAIYGPVRFFDFLPYIATGYIVFLAWILYFSFFLFLLSVLIPALSVFCFFLYKKPAFAGRFFILFACGISLWLAGYWKGLGQGIGKS